MEFEKVVNGIIKYLNAEIFPNMNDWQEILGRVAVSRVLGDSQHLKNLLLENVYVKTFGIIDDSGKVDVDGLLGEFKKQLEIKGKLTIALPVFGTFTFVPEDVEKLRKNILEV
jgi:hypothetical protein